jgi:glycosyltransferase involved in cell wall biosynthesis
MTDREPKISVVMAVFNSERFLSQSIESILVQSYEDFEFIIVDDGSTDHSWDIILKYHESDTRIRPIRLKGNQGVAEASNAGLQTARGKYIARMDSDDISLPDRFSTQVDFLEDNPDVGVLGSRMRCIDETGRSLKVLPITLGNLNIHWSFLFENPLNNPTIIFRKSLVDDYDLRYNTSFARGSDYDFISRLLLLTKGENLSKVLLYYRLHPKSLTYTSTDIDYQNIIQISTNAVKAYLPALSVSDRDIVEWQVASKGVTSTSKRQRAHLMPVYLKIWDAFCQKNLKEPGLTSLRRYVYAWAARMILYPPFQAGVLKALWLVTKAEWRWPLFLLGKLPYYLARRQI